MSRFKPSPPSQLILAIRADNPAAVEDALNAGGDPYEADMHGQKGVPLRTACFNGNLEIISLLLRKGADINVAGYEGLAMPLRLAFRNKQKDVVQLLLDHGSIIPAELDLSPLGVTLPEKKNTEEQKIKAEELNTKKSANFELSLEETNEPLPFIPAPQKFSEYKEQDIDLLLEDEVEPTINVQSKNSQQELSNATNDFQLESISFNLPQTDEIEHIDLEAVYGVDTNVLTADLLKLSTPSATTKNKIVEDINTGSEPIKRSGFWKIKR